jgi:uracil-DNA glycosylase
MKTVLQVEHLKPAVDRLQRDYGHAGLRAIYGAGCISRPRLLLLFMNPTARNLSAQAAWSGLRAPWIGTKNVWKLLHALGLITGRIFRIIQHGDQSVWTADFAREVYEGLSQKSVYITNLAKCTQIDARSLHDRVFKAYLDNTRQEISTVKPRNIVSFGNQVSSILLGRQIKVSDYTKNKKEAISIGNHAYDIFPTYYPVGQGMRNMQKAVERIQYIIGQ